MERKQLTYSPNNTPINNPKLEKISYLGSTNWSELKVFIDPTPTTDNMNDDINQIK